MANKRAQHTATLLSNGKVLAVGGNYGSLGELYDPASRSWSATGNPGGPPSIRHTATLLPNGKVLVAGGYLANYLALEDARLYDPSSGAWTTTGTMTTRRADHTATLLPDGRVLAAGGFFQNMDYEYRPRLASAEIYDPLTGQWTPTGSLVGKRARHTATLLPNGKVLVAGGHEGFDATFKLLATAELYDPATGTWSATGSLAHARSSHTATLLHNGKVLVAGGDGTGTAELYDPASGTWTVTGSLAGNRYAHTATLLPGHKVLIAGGGGLNPAYLATAELYDIATGTWSSTGPLSQARADHTATLLPNSQILVAGGFENTSHRNHYGDGLTSAELYTPPLTPPALLNISTRLRIQAGDNATMIGGFIITGTQPKTVVVRGIGPSLGTPGVLADPVIELHGSSGELLATNDNWKDTAGKQQIIDSGLAPKNELESALWRVMNPGAYTVVVRGKNGATGVGLFEVYDLDQTVDSKLANVSTRGLTQTGDDVMIGGIIVGGGSDGATAKVVVRAIGPSIPMADTLPDPTLEVRDGSGTLIAFNDNWQTRADGSSQQAEIEATTIPPTNELESAVVQTLVPGNYTAIVRGKNGTTGIALIEVYNLR